MDKSRFKTVITAEHKLLDLHLQETFRYRDLIMLLVKRDFTASYKQTLLGPLWAIIQPLLTTVVFTLVFGKLAGLTTADAAGYAVPGFLFYMSGNICWNYFSAVLRNTSSVFINNRRMMSKVYFPRLSIPVSTGISKLISFGIQFAMFVGFAVYYMVKGNLTPQISWTLVFVPLAILQMMLLGVGCGIIISSVTTKYRDLAYLVTFGLQLWQYGSPIAYGLNLVPEKYMSLYMMNPVTPIITTFRYGFFGFGYFDWTYYLMSWGVCLAVFFVGLVMFSRIERTFVDTV